MRLTVQCRHKQPPDAHWDMVTRHLFSIVFLASEPTFSSSSWIPGPWWCLWPRITRLTSSLCDGPRATEGSYLAAARAALETEDWRHPPVTVVTRCKLWSHRLHLSLTVWWLTDLLNYDDVKPYKVYCVELDYRHQIYLCHKTIKYMHDT